MKNIDFSILQLSNPTYLKGNYLLLISGLLLYISLVAPHLALKQKKSFPFFGVGRGSHFRKGEKHPSDNMALNLPSANTKFLRNCKTIGLSVSVLSCYKIYLFLSLYLSIFLSLSV